MTTSYDQAYLKAKLAAKDEFKRIKNKLDQNIDIDEKELENQGFRLYEPSTYYKYVGVSPDHLEMVKKATLNAFFEEYLAGDEKYLAGDNEQELETLPKLADRCIELFNEKIINENEKTKLLRILGIACKQYDQAEPKTRRRILFEKLAVLMSIVTSAVLAILYYQKRAISKATDSNRIIRIQQNTRALLFKFSFAATGSVFGMWDTLQSPEVDRCTEANEIIKQRLQQSPR